MTTRLSPQREAEIATAVAAYADHPMVGFNCCSAHPVADAVPELLAELAAVRKERDELQTRSRRLIEQWNERTETWAPLSSPEKNRESFEYYRALCSAYCEAADNLHNVLAGIDPDVPWHLRDRSEATR